jgi:hypothetical protein
MGDGDNRRSTLAVATNKVRRAIFDCRTKFIHESAFISRNPDQSRMISCSTSFIGCRVMWERTDLTRRLVAQANAVIFERHPE